MRYDASVKYALAHERVDATVLGELITVRPLSEDGLYTGSQRILQNLKSNGRLVLAIRNDGKSQVGPCRRRQL
jgi:hypothetical protein